MRSYQWLMLVKKELGLKSDNQTALAIGLQRSAISAHKLGKVTSLDDETCLKIAEILDIDPIEIITDQHMEAAKNPALRRVWQQLSKMASQPANASPIILIAAFFHFSNAFSGLANFMHQHCILCSIDKMVLIHKIRARFFKTPLESVAWMYPKAY